MRRRLIPLAATLSYVHYEIRIAGALSASLLGAFPAFSAETCGPETVLVGDLPDQSALHGVLAQVESLGLNLLEVRRRPDVESPEPCDDHSPHPTRASPPVKARSEIGGRMEPLDSAVDHVRGAPAGRLIVAYGDYECPYSRRALREIALVEGRLDVAVRFAFRHFPLTEIHPHALAASAAAEAAALQGRFWEMHELLFHRQKALEDDDLVRYAGELGLDVAAFERDWAGVEVLNRIRRDVASGIASGDVHGTPTLFIDGSAHRGGYDAASLLEALAR